MTGELVPENLVGHRVLDAEGAHVGKINQVFLDDSTGEATWVSVHTGMFGMRETLVPLQGARPVEEDIQVPYDKAVVKEAPQVDAERHITPEDEALVRDYFARQGGFPRQAQGEGDTRMADPGTGTAEGAASGAAMTGGTGSHGDFADRREGRGDEPQAGDPLERFRPDERLGGPGAGDTDDLSVLRHEERVDIGVERREGGQARMRRHVETERFEETVPLHHEELEVERRPITDPSQVPDPGHMEEDERTFTLYEERPVVSKEEVPVEEVHVRKRDVTHEEHIEGELRKERIDFEDEDGIPPRGPDSAP
ncbi:MULTISPECIES: DUF2382 domain-containing protein [unclassified Nocardiopsis]|uniref:DUF2382 domain-containing protein n=1 Tax=unclassified Nocardiopsis TaxID=2649073 RepID=UPI00066A9AB2|nr:MULTISPECIES: PRC and DUF2382 domain-containing protein [unclassified Nocardiopsis]MBQ1080941.1 PRC and DUF2382 domain-containing protein [Nocardiopsis sp. B62]